MDGRLSTYRADSELSRFNRSRKTDWIPASEEFVKVLREALSISDRSGGAFDVTVGPLVNLWGFGPERRRGLVPSQEEIEAALGAAGFRIADVLGSPAFDPFDPDASATYLVLADLVPGEGCGETLPKSSV